VLNIIGTNECKLDVKGRLQLPTNLRKQLEGIVEDGFVLKRNIHHKCLELIPLKEWNAELEKIGKLNRFLKNHSDFIRMFMAGVKMIELDNSGRIQLPKDLMLYAGINRDVVLSSALDRIEIWDKQLYEENLQANADIFSELAEQVMGNFQTTENQ